MLLVNQRNVAKEISNSTVLFVLKKMTHAEKHQSKIKMIADGFKPTRA